MGQWPELAGRSSNIGVHMRRRNALPGSDHVAASGSLLQHPTSGADTSDLCPGGGRHSRFAGASDMDVRDGTEAFEEALAKTLISSGKLEQHALDRALR